MIHPSKSKPLRQKVRFALLLIVLLLLLLFFPFFNQARAAQLLFNLLFSLVLIAALYAVSTAKRFFSIGLALIIPALVTRWFTLFSVSSLAIVVNYVATGIFLLFTIVLLLYALFHVKSITMNIVYEAICIYILLGVTWAVVFALIDYVRPGAFLGLDLAEMPLLDTLAARFELLLYFSYVTLTTLGYGDIVPALIEVKFLAIFEAILGQLYLATVIARFLGLYLMKRS